MSTSASRPTRIWWGTTEIDLGDGATLDFAGEQDFGPATAAFVNRQARRRPRRHDPLGHRQRRRSRLQRSRIDNLLEGRGSSVNQVEIGFGDGRQLFDLTSYTRHIGEDTTGDLLSKGVFTDRRAATSRASSRSPAARAARTRSSGEFSMLLDQARRAR